MTLFLPDPEKAQKWPPETEKSMGQRSASVSTIWICSLSVSQTLCCVFKFLLCVGVSESVGCVSVCCERGGSDSVEEPQGTRFGLFLLAEAFKSLSFKYWN